MPSVSVAGAFTSGGSQRTAWRRDPRYEFLDTFSHAAGRTTWKAGLDVRIHPVQRYLRQDFGGAWQFSSLQDYLTGQAASHTFDVGNPLVAFEQNEYAWFAQVEHRWQQVAFFAGVRHEFQSGVDQYGNVAPRLALSWSPAKSTVLRLGADSSTTAGRRMSSNKPFDLMASTPRSTSFQTSPSVQLLRYHRNPLSPDG